MKNDSPEYPFHAEASALVRASADELFAHLDDHSRLSSHMSERSWMMGGGQMRIETDKLGGKAVGSRITLAGRVFGLELRVDEAVTEHKSPLRKVWTTTGTPRLLVIGAYRMGFEIAPQGAQSSLRVFIDYAWPATGLPGRLKGALAKAYAQWCTQRMGRDAAAHFAAR